MQLCGEILKSCNGIQMEINNAYVTVKRSEDAKSIQVFSTCPDKWIIDGSSISHANAVQQEAKFVSRAGCGMFAAQGKIQSVLLTRNGDALNVSSCHAINVVKQDVFVNGARTALKSGATAFDVAPRDEVQVVVPKDYRGFIELKVRGNARINITEWQAGSVKILMAAASRAVLQAGKLFDLTSFTIRPLEKNPRYTIKANVEMIDAELVDIHLGNVGRVKVEHVKTDLLKATTIGAALDVQGFASDFELGDFGTGRVSLQGSFGIVEKLLTGPQGAEIQFAK
jgi:hypothetical protein